MNPIKIFHQAVENVKPAVATQTRKRGGRSYHVRKTISSESVAKASIVLLVVHADSLQYHGASAHFPRLQVDH